MESFVEEVETRACQDSLLLCSNKAALKLFLTAYPELSTPFNTIVSSHIETYLANIPFLQQLTSTKLTVLATMCRYESLDANCTVFEENSPSDKLYIVLNGKSTVLAPQWVGNATVMQQSLEWGNQQKRQDSDIADLKSGDYFGETSLFANINRTSTIRTREKSLFVTVGKKTFENFCAVCPEIKVKMQSLMKERLVSNLSSLGVPFLEGIPPATLQLLTSRVEVHDTQIDEVVFREGDAGDRFYIIVHGEVKVEKEHEKGEMEEDCNENSSPEIRSLGVLIAGNYFGEMALVSDLPRSATVISTSKSILLSIDQASFSAIFGKNQNSLAEFTLRFFRGSSELRHFVSHSLGMSIFRIFLRKSVAEENLDFWIAANEFQKSFKEEQSPESSKAKAEEIIFLYVTDGSMHQVNLPYSLKTSIEESAIHYNLFTNSADEIYRLMVRDSYARFKKATEFFAFFKYLGILIDDN
jgi:CRP-like cAMP-binding protein